jgi:hypothetical protein
MKCPKCGIWFGRADRCRNCGYEFSLAQRSGSRTVAPRPAGYGRRPLEELSFLAESGPAPRRRRILSVRPAGSRRRTNDHRAPPPRPCGPARHPEALRLRAAATTRSTWH